MCPHHNCSGEKSGGRFWVGTDSRVQIRGHVMEAVEGQTVGHAVQGAVGDKW